jgi:fucose permease
MIRNKTVLTGASFASMLFVGIGSTIIGAAARNIGLTPYQIGIMMAVQNLGFMLAVVLTGALSDVYEKPRIILGGSVVLAAAFYTFYLSGIFGVNLVIMFFVGTGIGSYEGVTDAMLLDIHNRKEGLYINVNHFFVTFGSLIITLYLVFLQMNWRRAVTQSGIAVSLLVIIFLFSKLETRGDSQEKLPERIKFLAGERAIGVLFFATICAVGMELGSVSIMTTYLMEFRGFNQITSKIALLIFHSGIASGRLLIGYFSKKRHISTFIALLFSSGILFLSILFFTDTGKYSYVLVYFAGMTISSLLPLIITLAGLRYKNHSGTALGIIKFAIPIGGTLIPFLLSMVTRLISFRASLTLFPLTAFVGFIVLVLNMKNLKLTEGT